MEYRPRIVPRIALSERVTPLQRVKRTLERPVIIAPAHQIVLLVEHVGIVHGSFPIHLYFFSRTAQRFAKTVDTPIIVGILQRAGRTLVYTHVVGHISKLIIILIAHAPRRTYLGMHAVGAMRHCLPQHCRIFIGGQSFKIRIGHYRRGVVAYHAISVSRARPLRQKTALTVHICPTSLHLRAHRRIHQIYQRKQRPERVPEPCPRKQVSIVHFAVVRAIMLHFVIGIIFIELMRE